MAVTEPILSLWVYEPANDMKVSLSGRTPITIAGHNPVAITTTANFDTTILDTAVVGGRKMIHVVNTLNRQMVINIVVYVSIGGGFTGGAIVASSKTFPAGGWGTITAADIRELGEPVGGIVIRASCSVAPSSGSLSAYLEGVQP